MLKGVGGGNFLILARSAEAALAAAEAAVDAIDGAARRHPAVPRRRGAQRQQGRARGVQER